MASASALMSVMELAVFPLMSSPGRQPRRPAQLRHLLTPIVGLLQTLLAQPMILHLLLHCRLQRRRQRLLQLHQAAEPAEALQLPSATD